jgi:membrane associated rhomboid family serine protease
MKCPRCPVELEPITSGGVALDRCRLCFGLWFDRGELFKFNQFDSDFPLAPGLPAQGTPTNLRCPRCRGLLRQTAYAPGASVLVDRCPKCEGVWLDSEDIVKVRKMMDVEARVRGKAAARLKHVVERERELRARAEAELAQMEANDRVSRGEWLFMFLTRLPREVYHPVHRFPRVTVALIAANMLAFGLEMLALTHPGGAELVLAYAFIPDKFRQAQDVWTILTSMFLHGGLVHLLGNMYYLYTFGDNVEEYMGALRFGLLYFACGLLGDISHLLSNTTSTVPTIGASGAISGVLAAYMLLFPRRKIYALIIVLPLKVGAVWYLGFWIALQVLFAFTTPVGIEGGTAFFAHVGGFLTGLALVACHEALKRRPILPAGAAGADF